MHIRTAEGAAWRAIYVYSGNRQQPGPLRFSIGIDPTSKPRLRGYRAELFGSVGFRKDCTGGRKSAWQWRLPLWAASYWYKLDGRRR